MLLVELFVVKDDQVVVQQGNERCFWCFYLQTFLATMLATTRELIVWSRHLSLFNNVYEFSMIIVPSMIVAPRYFSGEVRLTRSTQFVLRRRVGSRSMRVLTPQLVASLQFGFNEHLRLRIALFAWWTVTWFEIIPREECKLMGSTCLTRCNLASFRKLVLRSTGFWQLSLSLYSSLTI